MQRKGKFIPGALKPRQNKRSTCRSSQDHLAQERMQDSAQAWDRSGSRRRAKAKTQEKPNHQQQELPGRGQLGHPAPLGAGAGRSEMPLTQPHGSAPASAARNQPRECSQTLGANTQRGGVVHLPSPSQNIFWS